MRMGWGRQRWRGRDVKIKDGTQRRYEEIMRHEMEMSNGRYRESAGWATVQASDEAGC